MEDELRTKIEQLSLLLIIVIHIQQLINNDIIDDNMEDDWTLTIEDQ